MTKDLKIVFLGTPDFAVGVLKTLVEANNTIVGVITAPDRKKGRGRKVLPSAVKNYAVSQNIPVLQPTNLKNPDFLNQLEALNANLQIIVAFRMLPKVVWAMPALGTFNLHASLLPKYRGAAPINWAIINKETSTGVTTFFIDEKIDTGEIILSKEVAISPTETVGTLHDTLMKVGSQLVLDTVIQIKNGTVTTQPQPKGKEFEVLKLNEAPKLSPENTYIDWTQTADTIDHFIRGLNPYPAAWTYLQEGEERKKIKIFSVTLISEIEANQNFVLSKTNGLKISEDSSLGDLAIIHKKIFIQLQNNVLEINELQLPGKRKMKTKDLLNGYTFTEDAKMIVNPHD